MEPYLADAWHVLVRFGRWAEILARPLRRSRPGAERSDSGGMVWETMVREQRADDCCSSGPAEDDEDEEEEVFVVESAFGYYAKGIAYAALGDVVRARAMQCRFRRAVRRVPPDRCVHNVPSLRSLEVAESMLEGEIAYAEGSFDTAFDHLRQAVKCEAMLPYDEPPG
jgi:hypothetical protein